MRKHCNLKAVRRRTSRSELIFTLLVSGATKFDRGLLLLLHTELHRLDVPQRVAYKLSVMMFNGMHGQAPQYLVDFCHPASSVALRQQLRSASRRLLVVPRCRLSTTVRRAFSVAGPSVWNSLQDYLRCPAVGRDTFRQHVKTFVCFVLVHTAH